MIWCYEHGFKEMLFWLNPKHTGLLTTGKIRFLGIIDHQHCSSMFFMCLNVPFPWYLRVCYWEWTPKASSFISLSYIPLFPKTSPRTSNTLVLESNIFSGLWCGGLLLHFQSQPYYWMKHTEMVLSSISRCVLIPFWLPAITAGKQDSTASLPRRPV